MTISTTSSQTTLLGNGSNTQFGFNFIADSASDISVIYTDTNGTETLLLPAQYTLSLNAPAAGAIWGVGGTVTYPTSGPAIANGTSITITRVVPLTQETSISNQGDFAPEVIETALDTLCLEIQQVSARTGQIRATWATGVAYNYGDIVQDGPAGAGTLNLYTCAIANLSGVWATDLANGDWSLALNIQNLNALIGTYLPIAGGTILGNLTVNGVTTLVSGGTSTTPALHDNTTKIATTAFVQAALPSTPNINFTELTSGTTWTSPSGITSSTRFKITVIGGGGGGGGAASGVTISGTGGGGGGGSIWWVTGLTASTNYTYAIGTAGSGGNSSGSNGTSGGNTSITIGSTTVTANGGTNGTGSSSSGALNGGGGGGTSANGTINITGQNGHGNVAGTSALQDGAGGSAPFGLGLGGGSTPSSPSAGTGYGAGGSGGANGQNGGVGTQGIIIIEWIQ